MNLRVYNGERFERSKRWYIGFSVILISIILLSLMKKNIVGVVVLFFILGAYFYYSIISNQIIKIKTDDNHILIDKRTLPWSEFIGYVIEVENKSQEIKNIVLLSNRYHSIYTIHDKHENIKKFITELDNHIPMMGEYNQTFLEKMARILKL